MRRWDLDVFSCQFYWVEEVPISVSVSGWRLAVECNTEREEGKEGYIFAVCVFFFVAVGAAAHPGWNA